MTEAARARLDRLYELLPAVYRQRDVATGLVLRDVLRAIAEQVVRIEDDIERMYDDWFIETCQAWVTPYIGDLVGYPALQAAPSEGIQPPLARRALVPRRDVANYIRALRRRGTPALLENLAADSAGFPARAVEFFTLLGRSQALNHLSQRGRLVDLRDGEALDLMDSPFDRVAHTVGLASVRAARAPGRHNIPSAGVHLWRLRAYAVTKAPPRLVQRSGGHAFYTFSVLGNDQPLYTKAEREPDSTAIADEVNVPAPIRRRALELHRDAYYGAARSFAIWLNGSDDPVPSDRIVAADLSNWTYRPQDGDVAVDPERGRMTLAREAKSIRVSYRYGFSDDVGAHESSRTLASPPQARLYRVGAVEEHTTVAAALAAWQHDAPRDAVIEIADSDMYTERLDAIALGPRQTLQLRAANRTRPSLRVIDYDISRPERLTIVMQARARFTVDGLVLVGRPLRVQAADAGAADLAVAIRRCTLVPGWELGHDCSPGSPGSASLELYNVSGRVSIDRSIVGAIAVTRDRVEAEPVAVVIRDSIVDATAIDREALADGRGGYAWAALTIVRSTILGEVLAHALDLAETAIFAGAIHVVRKQRGCVRFCYVPPGSRTPRRYHCQPDLVVHTAEPSQADEERRRVMPRFTSTRYGDAGYGQLAWDAAPEIARGADDESELGAFHDMFVPQRVAGLRARLDHATPAGMDAGIIYVD